jgi:hydroxymethylpyrimidine pyrophosphatase-like HAD family hydrolase
VNGAAIWQAVAVDFTVKTQFLFMINKSIDKISDNKKVNEFMPNEDRPIPFDHMIYFGDGDTDIPCMKLIKQQGGNSIAVYKARNKGKKAEAEKLIRDDRVNFACVADYTKDSEVYYIVEAIIKQIKSKSDFENLQMKNHSRIITKE